MKKCKQAILHFEVHNKQQPQKDFISINFQQVLTCRAKTFEDNRQQIYQVGDNILSNHFHTLNKQFHLEWLNSFKMRCKRSFLPTAGLGEQITS
jgi:hypothetical protein